MIRPLFPDFARLWVLVCPSAAIARHRPTPLVVGSERVVLFRTSDGRPAALVDRCPHRGVALSLGRLEDGQIACPFHGWRFDGEGRCRSVPWNPDAKLETLSATALPVREQNGLIWLFTGTQAEGEPHVPETLTRPDVRITAQSFLWKAHWTRVMENMLDTPHLPFVHARTIGRHLRGRTAEKMVMDWSPTATGAEITATRAGEAPRSSLAFHYPNMMELKIDPPGKTLRLYAVCTPAEADTTRLTLITARSFAKFALLDPVFAKMNARIAEEDRAILESSDPIEVPPAGEERSVATDAPTLAFRKLWFTQIRGR